MTCHRRAMKEPTMVWEKWDEKGKTKIIFVNKDVFQFLDQPRPLNNCRKSLRCWTSKKGRRKRRQQKFSLHRNDQNQVIFYLSLLTPLTVKEMNPNKSLNLKLTLHSLNCFSNVVLLNTKFVVCLFKLFFFCLIIWSVCLRFPSICSPSHSL